MERPYARVKIHLQRPMVAAVVDVVVVGVVCWRCYIKSAT